MARFNKWLAGVAADAPAVRVGKQALRARLRAVVHYLDRVKQKKEQAESIHQLRIWTRRSSAALRLFAGMTPKKASKELKKRLRKIRRAAGAVRDCDVLLARLEEGQGEAPRSVIKTLKRRRRKAGKNLTAVRRELLRRGKFEKQAARLVDAIAWPKRHSRRRSPPFAAWCRMQLVPLGERFFELAGANLSKDAKLHELRIAGKRLRYALELSPAALPPRLHQRLYDALSDLQERLGIVCDHLNAVARLGEWRKAAQSKEDRGALKAATGRETRHLAARRQQFLRWWTRERCQRLRTAWNAALRRH